MSAEIQARSGQGAGFTLIELMVVVALVGVLATLAYPTYVEQMTKARRVEMQAQLMRMAGQLERRRTLSGCYNSDSNGDCSANVLQALDVPAAQTGYALAQESALEADAFRLVATPIADGPQSGDGKLTLDHLGLRGWDANDDGDTTDVGEDRWTP